MIPALLLILGQAPGWQETLPPNTLAVAGFENFGAFAGLFGKTGAGRIAGDPAFRTFLSSIKVPGGPWDAFGAKLAELAALPAASAGAIWLAGFPPSDPGLPPAFAAIADLKGDKRLEDFVRKTLVTDLFGEEPGKRKVGELEVEWFERAEMALARDGTVLILSNDAEVAAALVQRHGRKQAESLATNPRYRHARGAVEANERCFFLFIDQQGLLQSVPPAAQALAVLGAAPTSTYSAVAAEPDGDHMLYRTHGNVDLAAPSPGKARELLETTVGDLSRRPGVTAVEVGGTDYGALARALLSRIRDRHEPLEALLKNQGIDVDLSKLPVDLLAAGLGRSTDVTIQGPAGLTMISRSNAGPPLPGGGGVAMTSIVAAIAIPGLLRARTASNERNATANLKALVTAEENFRGNDLDGNGAADYWVGDLSGLARIKNRALGDPLLPGADADPLPEGREAGGAELAPTAVQAPKAGYWFRTVPHYEGDGGAPKPYNDGKNRNGSRFAFCAYPAAWDSTGNFTFFIDETARLWRKDLEGAPLKVVPRDPATEGWGLIE